LRLVPSDDSDGIGKDRLLQENMMKFQTPRKPHSTPVQDPDDVEAGLPLMEPDDGLVPPAISEDPEYDRVVEPED
jgi:hypothetical protein